MNREGLSVYATLVLVVTLTALSGCPCRTDADCDDGLFCNGAERCVDGRCQDGDPPCAIYENCNEESGTGEDGEINQTVIPLDVQAWAILAFGSESGYQDALAWAEVNCALEHNGYHGFDFNTDLDGVWF
jgi:hypothetical protein